MKKPFFFILGLILVSCHPAEFTTVEINATTIITNEPADGVICSITESDIEIDQKETVHGQTKIAFGARSHLSYKIDLSAPSAEYKLVNIPPLRISRGQRNTYDVNIAKMSVLDLGLQSSISQLNGSDKLEYQIFCPDYQDQNYISAGWNYGEADINGEIHNDHYAQYKIPSGHYTFQWRTTINGQYQTGSEKITVIGDTTHYVFHY